MLGIERIGVYRPSERVEFKINTGDDIVRHILGDIPTRMPGKDCVLPTDRGAPISWVLELINGRTTVYDIVNLNIERSTTGSISADDRLEPIGWSILVPKRVVNIWIILQASPVIGRRRRPTQWLRAKESLNAIIARAA